RRRSNGLPLSTLLLCNSDGQCNRLSSMLRLEGVALRYAEPVPPEAAYQRLAEAKLLRKNATKICGLRDAEAAATADALKSSNVAEQMPQTSALLKEDANTASRCSDNSQTLLTNQIRTMSSKLNEEFLLKPSDEDGDWVIGDPSPPSAAAPPAAATEDSSASTSTSFCHSRSSLFETKRKEAERKRRREAEAEPEPVVEAEQETEPEADAEPEVEAEADPEAEVEPEAEPEADNAVICLPFVLWATNSVGQIFKLDRCESQSKLSLSHLDCSDERMGRWCSSLTESGAAVCVLNYVREQGLFFLLDIDTGYSKVMPTGNMRPVFNLRRPHRRPSRALLTSSAKLRVYIVRKAFCPATMSCLLASIVLLPDNREISQELIDGLPWLDRDQKTV
uniref:Tudor domain-containing protein n=1 Tax=Macrostomum lignano TaxID=282301 RepID=A0A1I8FJ50_9PLAT